MERVYVVQYDINDDYNLTWDSDGTYVFASLDGAMERFSEMRERFKREYGCVNGAEVISDDDTLYEVDMRDERTRVYVSLREMEVMP